MPAESVGVILGAMETLHTIIQRADAEPLVIKKSRFLATATPCQSVEEAQAAVKAARAMHPDARHHCYAWVVDGSPLQTRATDDGEPRQTAGLPILRQLEGKALRNVVVVVTRYFGGTKLGTGGLSRAYGEAAKMAIDAAGVHAIEPTRVVTTSFAHGLMGNVQRVLHHRGLQPADTTYGQGVTMTFVVPAERAEGLRTDLVDATSGAASVKVSDEGYHTNPRS